MTASVVNERIKLGVVGVGAMGQNHCRVALGVPGLELIGVFDVDHSRASDVAEQYGTRAFMSLDALLATTDAVVIAAPTSSHVELGLQVITKGRHLLVEKPLAGTVEGARKIAEAARRAGVVCAVGHIERHNATFTELLGVLDSERPVAVSTRRLNYFAPRITDADVTLDLLIHDVDLVLALAGELPSVVSATGMRFVSERLDHVDALLAFPSGTLGSLTASRVTEHKIRRIEVISVGRYVVADLLARTLRIHRRAAAEWEAGGPDVKFRLESVTQEVHVPAIEPLHLELVDLADAIRRGRSPKVTAEDGVRALDVILGIQRIAERQEAPPIAQPDPPAAQSAMR